MKEYNELILMKILNKKLYNNQIITKEMYDTMEIELDQKMRRVQTDISLPQVV